MIKVTVLFNHPTHPQEFERYYADKHLPIAGKMHGFSRLELTRFGPGPDGGKPAFYRMAELYFPSQAQMQTTLGSAEGQTAVADIANFATGGVLMLFGSTDS